MLPHVIGFFTLMLSGVFSYRWTLFRLFSGETILSAAIELTRPYLDRSVNGVIFSQTLLMPYLTRHAGQHCAQF